MSGLCDIKLCVKYWPVDKELCPIVPLPFPEVAKVLFQNVTIQLLTSTSPFFLSLKSP